MFPYMIVHLIMARIKQSTRDKDEHPYDRIGSGVWLGRYPFSSHLYPPNCDGEVDLCAELPRPGFIHPKHYCYVPCLDACLPPPDLVIHKAKKVLEWNCPIYVHCMHGHGRSLAFSLVFLVLRGDYPDIKSCYDHVKSVRPRVGLKAKDISRYQNAIDQYKESILEEGNSSIDDEKDHEDDFKEIPIEEIKVEEGDNNESVKNEGNNNENVKNEGDNNENVKNEGDNNESVKNEGDNNENVKNEESNPNDSNIKTKNIQVESSKQEEPHPNENTQKEPPPMDTPPMDTPPMDTPPMDTPPMDTPQNKTNTTI